MKLAVPLVLLLVVVAAVGALWWWQAPADLPPSAADAAAAVDGSLPRHEAASLATGAAEASAAGAEAAAVRELAARETDAAPGAVGPHALVRGQIVDAEKRPLADVEVLAAEQARYETFGFGWPMPEPTKAGVAVTTRSDAEGRFEVRVPTTLRRVWLTVTGTGFVILYENVVRGDAEETDVGTLQLVPAALVRGQVVDRAGAPIAGVFVARQDPNSGNWMPDFAPPPAAAETHRFGRDITDRDGRFELAHAQPGDAEIVARHRDYLTNRLANVTLAATAPVDGLRIVLEVGAKIRGRVVGAPAGAKLLVTAAPRQATAPTSISLGGAERVSYGGGQRQADVAADGSFEVTGLAPGAAFALSAAEPAEGQHGHAPTSVCTNQIDVTAGTTGIELRYLVGAALTFVVTAGPGGSPVERLRVRHRFVADGATTGAGTAVDQPWRDWPAGRVHLEHLRPRPKRVLQVRVEAVGFAPWERSGIVLPQEGAHDLGTVALQPAPVADIVVVQANGGAPVAEASVRFEVPGGTESGPDLRFSGAEPSFGGRQSRSVFDRATTDAAGSCRLNVPASGKLVLVVEHPSFALHRGTELAAAEAAVAHRVELSPGGTLLVTVHGIDGAPLAQAQVERRGPDGRPTTAAADRRGQLRSEHLVAGTHRVRIGGGQTMFFAGEDAPDLPGGEPWTEVQVAEGQVATATLTMTPKATLRGIVRENGAPLAGAEVQLVVGAAESGPDAARVRMLAEMEGQRRAGTTAADGSFTLTGLPPGDHTLRIAGAQRAMVARLPVTLVVGDNATDVDLDLTQIQGTVRDSDGKPIAAVRVSVATAQPRPGIRPGGQGTETDAEGRYTLRGVEPGTALVVRATSQDFAPASSDAVTCTAGETKAGVDLTLRAAGKIEFTADAAVFLMVRARWAGASVDGVPRAPSTVVSGGKGTMGGLLPGRWELTVRAANDSAAAPTTRTVDVVAGTVTKVAL
jgi:protocatechuate 3,4-dioxygenase beta subunit